MLSFRFSYRIWWQSFLSSSDESGQFGIPSQTCDKAIFVPSTQTKGGNFAISS